MSSSSRTLTVAYGGFSCTLEGFDDPLAEMRRVAEFVRDLAAGDRSFGTLPTVPARIQPPTARATPPRGDDAADPCEWALAEGDVEEEAEWEATAAMPSPAPVWPNPGEEGLTVRSDDVAAKLRRIREVVGRMSPPAPHPQAPAEAYDADPEDGDPEDETDAFQAEAEDDALRPVPGRLRLAGGPDGDETGVARILSVTDAQLAEPSASRRREAMAQLKAAVTATVAARRLGEPPAEADDPAEPFRDDLREVAPSRPVAATPDSGTSEPQRLAPLRLVASQRVDVPADPAVSATVRPRRVRPGAAPATAQPAHPDA